MRDLSGPQLGKQPLSAVHLRESPAPCAPRDVTSQKRQHEKSFELILNGRLLNGRWIGCRPVIRWRVFDGRRVHRGRAKGVERSAASPRANLRWSSDLPSLV